MGSRAEYEFVIRKAFEDRKSDMDSPLVRSVIESSMKSYDAGYLDAIKTMMDGRDAMKQAEKILEKNQSETT